MPMHKDKILQLAKGFRGRANNCISLARNKVEKALQYAYRDRRNKKRDMRALWIQRINAGAKQHGVPYSRLMHGLAQENIRVNRKVLSELAMNEPHSFKALVDQVRLMRGGAVGTAPAPVQPVDSQAGTAAPRVSL